jgi:putative lipase involved disintegration of autophagic bodies
MLLCLIVASNAIGISACGMGMYLYGVTLCGAAVANAARDALLYCCCIERVSSRSTAIGI